VILILSFVPNVILALAQIMGEGWPEAFVLMTMHAVVWAICVTLLPSLAITKRAPTTQPSGGPLAIL